MHKVVPPPHWTGIDATQDPDGLDVVEIARAGWHRAQQQPPEVEMQPEEFFARLKRNIDKNRLPELGEDTQPPQNTP